MIRWVILTMTVKFRACIVALLGTLALVAVLPAYGQTAVSTERRDFATLETAAKHVWNRALTPCRVADRSGASLDYFKTTHYPNQGAGITELRGVTFHTIDKPVSEAERSNGVQWHGWAVAVASVYKELEHYQDPIEQPEWTKWFDGSKWNVNISPNFFQRHLESEWYPGAAALAFYVEKSEGIVRFYPDENDLPAKPLCSGIPGTVDFKQVPEPTNVFWVSLSPWSDYAEKRVIKKGESVDFYEVANGNSMAQGWPVTIDRNKRVEISNPTEMRAIYDSRYPGQRILLRARIENDKAMEAVAVMLHNRRYGIVSKEQFLLHTEPVSEK